MRLCRLDALAWEDPPVTLPDPAAYFLDRSGLGKIQV